MVTLILYLAHKRFGNEAQIAQFKRTTPFFVAGDAFWLFDLIRHLDLLR